MLRIFLLFVFLSLFAGFSFAEERREDEIVVGNTKFTLVQIDKDNGYVLPQSVLELYRNGKKLLTHTMTYIEGDCNSETVELGAYKIGKNEITFYSYWALQGDAPVSPYGVRKQVYNVDNNGRLRRTHSTIYLEAMRSGWGKDDYQGVDFIYENPTNESEKKLLDNYKKAIERDFHATFILSDSNKKLLFEEVRTILKDKIDKATSGWEELGGVFYYKK